MSPERRAALVALAHRRDAPQWVRDRLDGHLWSKQIEVARSVAANRYTAVPSAHQTGKSHLAALLACWWLSTRPTGEGFVVTTAPTSAQVESILFRYIRQHHQAGGLKGEVTGGSVPLWKIDGEIVAMGRSVKDNDPAAFQGIHARRVLVIIDEAGGVSPMIWAAVDSLVANDDSRVLAIGNPDTPDTAFARACAPGSGWNTIQISGLDTPNLTGEPIPDYLAPLLMSANWPDERAKRWGPKSSLYMSKVLGEFPEAADDTLISATQVRAAQKRDLSGEMIADPGRYGWDIARLGSDETVGYLNRGGVVRRIYARHRQTTDVTTGDIAAELAKHPRRTSKVDSVGVGAGVFDALRAQGHQVQGFEAGNQASRHDRFVNQRAEAWWSLRTLFEAGLVDIDPDDDELAAQLQAPRWWREPSGRMRLESKAEMAKRGVASPDRADAVVMAFLRPVAVVQDDAATDAHPRTELDPDMAPAGYGVDPYE